METVNLPTGANDRAQGLHPDTAALGRGTVLQGRYEITKVLGQGGMGAVYQARDRHFRGTARLCALKEMVSTTRDPQLYRVALQNFEREANILASLNHPSIPKIYDYFTEDVRNYLVLEHVDGYDLEAVLHNSGAPLPVGRAVDWAVQICEVLTYLHNQNPPVIFRDMKPSNIMIRQPNQIVLIDFGIARVFSGEQKGTMIGTEGYSPPEQYRGVASPEGDIYALGATLHHLLTLRDPRAHPPFTYDEVPIQELNPQVPAQLAAVVDKMLAYEPHNRFQSAAEAREALRTFSVGLGTISIASTGDTSEQQKQGIPAAAPATTSSHITPVWRFQCEDEIRSSPVVADDTLYVGSYDHNLYALDVHKGELRWKYTTEGGIPASPCVWKDRVLIGSEDRLLYAVSANAGRILWTCPTGGRIRSSARVEFEHAFFGSDDKNLYAVNAHNGRQVWTFEAEGPIRSSPVVGDEIVYVGCEDGHLYAIDMQSGSQRWRFRTNRGITASPTLHNGLVVFGSTDWTVYALDETSGWAVWRFRTAQMVVGAASAADDMVYVGSVDGHLYALDASNGRLIWKHATSSQIISRPAIAEKHIFVGTVDGHLLCLEKASGKERWRFTARGGMTSSPFIWQDLVFIGSHDHHIYALPATDGK
jgi:eukaryotic-like serine/threonine-protein kinase